MKKWNIKNNVFTTAITCTLIDITLISAGTLGLGNIINGSKVLLLSSTIFGILFLSYYGIFSILKAIKGIESLLVHGDSKAILRKKLLLLF
ncbi:LysE family transporter [Psychrilyobacter sp.]|uniref:LysE family transporter n=1 Tax=Psychrilyobacter sp. TaxID=2586924 RepID=UPI003C782C1F